MSETSARPRRSRRSELRAVRPAAKAAPGGSAGGCGRPAVEIADLVRLAEIDAALLARGNAGVAPADDEMVDERHGLGARLSSDLLEAYERALRGGRQPAVVPLESSVCSGCHVRLHSTLEQKVRRVRGVGACPRCLRLVYDPGWLEP